LGIGGSGPTKKWKISNYINLGRMICKKNIFTFIIAGGPLEIHEADEIKKILNDCQIKSISICDREISDTLEFLNESKLYIGNDTGFMHLSGCLGVKSFGLFGDSPINYGSYNKHIVPITPKGVDNIGYNSRMMENINVQHVYDKIKFFL